MNGEPFLSLIKKIKIVSMSDDELVDIKSLPTDLTCIGKGTDAAVFVHPDYPQYACKVYAKDKDHKRKNEEKAYQKLGENPYFPTFYASGKSFILMSREEGINLYDCLIEGIEIPKQAIAQVDQAIQYARSVGLNPRDIHFKNILLQGDTIKVIDVSEYVLPGDDKRWEHLKEGYRLYYPLVAAKKVPASLIEFVKRQYRRQKDTRFSIKKFARQVAPAFFNKTVFARFIKKKKPSK